MAGSDWPLASNGSRLRQFVSCVWVNRDLSHNPLLSNPGLVSTRSCGRCPSKFPPQHEVHHLSAAMPQQTKAFGIGQRASDQSPPGQFQKSPNLCATIYPRGIRPERFGPIQTGDVNLLRSLSPLRQASGRSLRSRPARENGARGYRRWGQRHADATIDASTTPVPRQGSCTARKHPRSSVQSWPISPRHTSNNSSSPLAWYLAVNAEVTDAEEPRSVHRLAGD